MINTKELALLIGLIITILFSQTTAFAEDCDLIRDNTLRLHIMAHSNEDIDQDIKLMVRDSILANSGELFNFNSYNQLKDDSQEIITKAVAIANTTLKSHNYPYTATAEIVEDMYFTTRYYEGIAMPAGRYTALRINIGSGQGENWWCVLYPPICLPSAQPEEDNPTSEQIEDINQDVVFKPSFAVVEWWQGVKYK